LNQFKIPWLIFFFFFSADDETNNYDPADGWEFVTFEDQKIGIKTSNLEEKCTAVEMLYCYAKVIFSFFKF